MASPSFPIGKNIGKDAADLASKAAEKNIKYISKEVVDEIAPDPIDYAKKIAASTNPSNALVLQQQVAIYPVELYHQCFPDDFGGMMMSGRELASSIAAVRGWKNDFSLLWEHAGRCFRRRDTRSYAEGYVRALLGRMERKNGWQMAEYLGVGRPYPVQHFLGKTRGKTRGRHTYFLDG